MTESSTITQPARPAFACPPWCERTDHDADVVDADNPPVHYGPEFGPVAVQQRDGTWETVISSPTRSAEDFHIEGGPDVLEDLLINLVKTLAWTQKRAEG